MRLKTMKKTVSEIDIYRSAKIFVDKYGGQALLKANAKLSQYIKVNNDQSVFVWKEIIKKIEWLQNPENEKNTTCH